MAARTLVILFYGWRGLIQPGKGIMHNLRDTIIKFEPSMDEVSTAELGDRWQNVHEDFRTSAETQITWPKRDKFYYQALEMRLLESYDIKATADSPLIAALADQTIDNAGSFRTLPGFSASLEWLSEIKRGSTIHGDGQPPHPWSNAFTGFAFVSPAIIRGALESAGITVRSAGRHSTQNVFDVGFLASTNLPPSPVIRNDTLGDEQQANRFRELMPTLREACIMQNPETKFVDFLLVNRDPRVTAASRRAGWNTLLALGREFHGIPKLEKLKGHIVKAHASKIYPWCTRDELEDIILDFDDLRLWRPQAEQAKARKPGKRKPRVVSGS